MGSEAQSLERQLSSKVNCSERGMRKGEASKPEADVASVMAGFSLSEVCVKFCFSKFCLAQCGYASCKRD